MHILGVSAYFHDSAACLLRDGAIVAAAQEERWSRIKHDPALPVRATEFCLNQAGLRGDELDSIVFYEKPLLKLERILETCLDVAPQGAPAFVRSMPSWFVHKLRVEEELRQLTGFSGDFFYCRHHMAHGASAFYPSPFDEAAVLSVDGVGEWATNTIGHGVERTFELLAQIAFPHSLGLLYSAFTQLLGFRVNSGEYKVMGLAPYGEPKHASTIRSELLDIKEDGSYELNLDHFAFLRGESTIGESFAPLFGTAARTESDPLEQIHMDIARSIQAVTEDVLLRQARFAAKRTGSSNLCMAGGVALNSVANGKILKEGIFDEVWIQPAAGDAGGAVGAALYLWNHFLNGDAHDCGGGDAMQGGYLGPRFDRDEIFEALAAAGLADHCEELEPQEMDAEVARLLAEQGNVVGLFQERMEFGPRALGHRSIVADPRREDIQERVNAKVKFREGFRPFAPAVLEDAAKTWFEIDRPSPYMLFVVPVAEEKRRELSAEEERAQGLKKLKIARSVIPSVTHVDWSCRVQTVSKDRAPRFWSLLKAFEERTGCPVLLNTSFNLRGEPICCTPADACGSFRASGLDALAIGPFLVRRPEDAKPTGEPPKPPPPNTALPTKKKLRTFGISAACFLAILCAINGFLGHLLAAKALGGLGGALLLTALFAPAALAPVERRMAAFGKIVSRIVGAVALTLVYFGVVTPVGLLRRLLGKQAVRRRRAKKDSLWRETKTPGGLEAMKRMY